METRDLDILWLLVAGTDERTGLRPSFVVSRKKQVPTLPAPVDTKVSGNILQSAGRHTAGSAGMTPPSTGG